VQEACIYWNPDINCNRKGTEAVVLEVVGCWQIVLAPRGHSLIAQAPIY